MHSWQWPRIWIIPYIFNYLSAVLTAFRTRRQAPKRIFVVISTPPYTYAGREGLGIYMRFTSLEILIKTTYIRPTPINWLWLLSYNFEDVNTTNFKIPQRIMEILWPWSLVYISNKSTKWWPVDHDFGSIDRYRNTKHANYLFIVIFKARSQSSISYLVYNLSNHDIDFVISNIYNWPFCSTTNTYPRNWR